MKQKAEINRQVAKRTEAPPAELLARKQDATVLDPRVATSSSQHSVTQGPGRQQRPAVGGYYREQLPPINSPSLPAA
jgi:hypothetical protein